MQRVALGICLSFLLITAAAQAELYEVSMTGGQFQPFYIQANIGDTVRWTNDDSNAHFITTYRGEFYSGPLYSGQQYTRVFNGAGSFNYVCIYHSGMTGRIDVGTSTDSVWTELASPAWEAALHDVDFLDAERGWIAWSLGVLRTTNGGDSWTPSNFVHHPRAVHFVNENEGWTAGVDGEIRHTVDGGATWEYQNSSVGEGLNDIWFTDALHGWAGGWEGLVTRTTNGGQSWIPLSLGHGQEVRAIWMADTSEGWLAGRRGRIWHTTNGGESWNLQLDLGSQTLDCLEAIHAFNNQHLWVAGAEGMIYRTTNGGADWTAVASGTTVTLNDITFTTPDSGWVCGTNGYIAVTTDGGESWQPLTPPPTYDTFNGLHFVTPNHGYFVSWTGRIFRYQNPEPYNYWNDHHAFAQSLPPALNYPNPFNPATTIAFEVLEAAPVHLEIFDVLGRSVAVLADGHLPAGAHRVSFSGQNLPSGHYFAQLRTGDHAQTWKMQLLR